MPASLVFRDASSRDVFTAIARFAEHQPRLRSGVPRHAGHHRPAQRDARGRARRRSPASTRTFFRVTAPRTITVIPDTPAKRREYEEEVVRTFYLSNADLKETMDLLRIVVDARRISPTTATNALTIKDTPERIAAAGARASRPSTRRGPKSSSTSSCSRSIARGCGVRAADRLARARPGINGVGRRQPTRPDADAASAAQPDAVRHAARRACPALYYRLLKTDTNTRTLANPQLRTTEGIAAQARFGEQVPVPVTTFAPIATGGTPSSRSRRSTTRTSASTSTSRRARTTTTTCRWR